MRRTVLFILAALLCAAAGAYGASTCADTACGASDLCCEEPSGAKCYDPEKNTCLVNERGENRLCGFIGGWFPADICGDACYDKYEFSCCNGQLYSNFFTKNNPCLNPPGSIQPGCEECGNTLSCCIDVNNGAQCYAPEDFLCHNNENSTSSVLCAIQDDVPSLVCKNQCYRFDTHTCCNGELYSKDDSTYACAPRMRNMTIEAEYDTQVGLTSNGFSSPGGTLCGWNATSNTETFYQLRNCTQWYGAGGFHFDEDSYLASFPLPSNSLAYAHYEIDIYVDNTQGGAQKAAFAVLDNDLPAVFSVENTTLYTYPCNTHKLFAPPIHYINIDIEAGFSGYKTVDITPLAVWSFSSNPADNLQLLISSATYCSCYQESCCLGEDCGPNVCTCESTQFSIAGAQSSYPPKLILNA